MGYRIDVFTESVPEAIGHVGGLMFDRGRAGWRVVVVTDDVAHRRALTVLGAVIEPPGEVDDGLHAAYRHVRITSSAVGHPAAQGDPAQRLLWGPPARQTTSRLHPVRHHLSSAARIFKAQALYCTGLTASVEPWEYFWADEPGASGFTDLAPAGTDVHLSGSVH